MTEEQKSDISLPEQQIAKPVRTLESLLKLYDEGHRNFSNSDLRGATVDIIDPEIKVLNLQDIILRGSNLKAIKLERRSHQLKVDLTGADLSECNLQGANLSRCRLDQCNFTNSNLRKVNFSESSCLGSDFIKATFYRTGINGNFTAADFTGADLRSSGISGNFSHAIFCDANLEKASFSYFHAHNADFSNSNLQDVEFPTPTTVTFEYSYYNRQTKLNSDFNPISKKMEFIGNNISADD
jgi:uncharacterized protein YjbI with pentapeptide repeats